MPGARLSGGDGVSFTGTVIVKIGPVQASYDGQVTFRSRDESRHVAVIVASGREARGGGTAAATITATLTAAGPDATEVTVVTDLTITGRPAQFGRGVIAEVGGKLMGQFADCLAEELARVDAVSGSLMPPHLASGSVTATDGGARPTEAAVGAAEPIDLLGVAGASVAKRALPLLAAFAILLMVFRRSWRRA